MKFRNGIRLSARYNRLRKTFACSLTVWTTLNSRERPSADFVAPALGGPCRSLSEREKATNNFEATHRIASSQLARLNCFELTLKNVAPRGNGVRSSSWGERNRKSQAARCQYGLSDAALLQARKPWDVRTRASLPSNLNEETRKYGKRGEKARNVGVIGEMFNSAYCSPALIDIR